VCTLVNSSFNIALEYTNGDQTISELAVDAINELSVLATCSGNECAALSAYFASFLAWTSILNGNVTMYPGIDGWQLVDTSSNVLTTRLAACDDIANTCWNSPSLQQDPAFHIQNVTDQNFPAEAWKCRNRTIDRAIEDLVNNVTLSMLGTPELR
jgi:hypothetical protein